MIYGQQSGKPAGSVWSIALSTAMGGGAVPRSSEEPRALTASRRPWPRTRVGGDADAATRRT